MITTKPASQLLLVELTVYGLDGNPETPVEQTRFCAAPADALALIRAHSTHWDHEAITIELAPQSPGWTFFGQANSLSFLRWMEKTCLAFGIPIIA